MNDNDRTTGGCFTEVLAMLVFLWLLFHWAEVQVFLDRLLTR